jgi:hypothetical protein
VRSCALCVRGAFDLLISTREPAKYIVHSSPILVGVPNDAGGACWAGVGRKLKAVPELLHLELR